jgi:membrane-associated protease RseP (regulator of RpoE activity)
MGAALAAALWAAPADRALAQASADVAADAATDAADDVSASGSTSAATDAASGAADTSASTSGSAQADTSPAGTQADAQASGNVQGSTSGAAASDTQSSSTPSTAPSASTDSAAQTGVNANANLDANAQASQATAPSNQTDAAAAGSTNVDANLQGQPGLNAQTGTNVQAGLSTQAQTAAQQQLRTGLQFGQPTAQGLAINALEPSNLFFNSGVRPGDVLVSYAGRPVRSQADFWRYAVWQPGQRIPVVVLRDGRQQTIYVTYQQQPGFIQHRAAYAPQSQAYLGVTFDANVMHAAAVRTVTPGSPAEQAGLRAGDHIVALNGNRVHGANDVIRTVQTMQPGASLDIAFTRPVENRTQVTLGQRPGVAQASYGPDVRVQTYGAAPSVPAPPTPPSTTVQTDSTIESAADPTPRVDRPADFDDDGRVLDRDQRVDRVGRDRGRPGGIR